ncbi:uncharacterized protein K460DRAFT_44548 [Cucurbitaria berberidis CBS 394.84]|uniref:Uncharacterized protein n=1 Tax=Cucurbitaria berberidis CBS 394.84 TaxID=1168544 RepID=A0A9P4GUV7_9PLEO|nr:uncharacterized protein K460DRAFT_44548 [Cucurbitaria berberidis CBS 394.84]KAF1851969.1 hypothetical protein K460DRAFT_44548 [Cucurbitaria berberidis CBS 394.84]
MSRCRDAQGEVRPGSKVTHGSIGLFQRSKIPSLDAVDAADAARCQGCLSAKPYRLDSSPLQDGRGASPQFPAVSAQPLHATTTITTITITMADSSASATDAVPAESPAQTKARLRRERLAAKSGASRLQQITALQGGPPKDISELQKDVPGTIIASFNYFS